MRGPTAFPVTMMALVLTLLCACTVSVWEAPTPPDHGRGAGWSSAESRATAPAAPVAPTRSSLPPQVAVVPPAAKTPEGQTSKEPAAIAETEAPPPAPISSQPEPAVSDDDWGNEEIEDVAVEKFDPDAPGEHWYGEAYPRLDRGINVPYARSARPWVVVFLIEHRNFQSVSDDPAEDFLGFDAGNLKIGLGLRLGLHDRMDVGFYRLNGRVEPFDTYEFDTTLQVLRQESGDALDLALRPGISWFAREHDSDATGALGQILVTRTFFPRLILSSGFLYHSDSTNDVKRGDDTDYSAAIPLAAEVRLLEWLAVNGEMSASVAGYRAPHPIFTIAPKVITSRHTFAVVLSNNQYTSADGIVANTWRGIDDLILGFTITRELGG